MEGQTPPLIDLGMGHAGQDGKAGVKSERLGGLALSEGELAAERGDSQAAPDVTVRLRTRLSRRKAR